MKNLSIKFSTICLTFLMSSFFVYGQVDSPPLSKEHFIFHKNGADIDVEKLTKYIYSGYFDLDPYRFYDKRRIIEIDHAGATIELYSAKELFDIYGKIVSDFTIMPGAPFKEIYFTVYPDSKGLKPQLK